MQSGFAVKPTIAGGSHRKSSIDERQRRTDPFIRNHDKRRSCGAKQGACQKHMAVGIDLLHRLHIQSRRPESKALGAHSKGRLVCIPLLSRTTDQNFAAMSIDSYMQGKTPDILASPVVVVRFMSDILRSRFTQCSPVDTVGAVRPHNTGINVRISGSDLAASEVEGALPAHDTEAATQIATMRTLDTEVPGTPDKRACRLFVLPFPYLLRFFFCSRWRRG